MNSQDQSSSNDQILNNRPLEEQGNRFFNNQDLSINHVYPTNESAALEKQDDLSTLKFNLDTMKREGKDLNGFNNNDYEKEKTSEDANHSIKMPDIVSNIDENHAQEHHKEETKKDKILEKIGAKEKETHEEASKPDNFDIDPDLIINGYKEENKVAHDGRTIPQKDYTDKPMLSGKDQNDTAHDNVASVVLSEELSLPNDPKKEVYTSGDENQENIDQNRPRVKPRKQPSHEVKKSETKHDLGNSTEKELRAEETTENGQLLTKKTNRSAEEI